MVIMKANPKQGRATAENYFSYLWSSFLLMATNHALFYGDRVFGFHLNAHPLKLVITECMISTFKHRQLLSSVCIFAYVPHVALPVGRGFNYTPS